MSNCIKIEMKARVDFKPYEIDSIGLYNFIKEANEKVNRKNCVKYEGTDKDSPGNNYIAAWWFLTGNVEFRKTGSVTIWFGESNRSSHTWRDFRYTLKVLSSFVKTTKWNNFGISDEYDGYETIERYAVNLKTGEFKK